MMLCSRCRWILERNLKGRLCCCRFLPEDIRKRTRTAFGKFQQRQEQTLDGDFRPPRSTDNILIAIDRAWKQQTAIQSTMLFHIDLGHWWWGRRRIPVRIYRQGTESQCNYSISHACRIVANRCLCWQSSLLGLAEEYYHSPKLLDQNLSLFVQCLEWL